MTDRPETREWGWTGGLPSHYSPTQSGMYARCPQQYSRRYVEGEKIPPGVAQLRGIGFHAAAGANHHQKIVSGADLPLDELKDMGATAFDGKARADGIWFCREETAIGADKVAGQAKDLMMRFLLAYHVDLAPGILPTHAEQMVAVTIPGYTEVIGYVDLVEAVRIRDLKTTTRSPDADAAHRSDQLTFYGFGWAVRGGHELATFRQDSIVVAAKSYKIIQQDGTRDWSDYEALVEYYKIQLDAIRAGVFPGVYPTGNWQCSEKWCGYWPTCKCVPPRLRRGGKIV